MPSYPVVTVRDPSAYAYSAGTAAGTVNVPAEARLETVSVVAGSGGSATCTIGGGNTITIPASATFSDNISGATKDQDVVIGGTVASYYVSWTAS